jgi:hypothetical protein
MNHALHRNATRILNNPTMQMAITHCDQYHHHPTNSSKYRFFSHKVARAIYNSKESTYLTPDIHAKADFLVTILSLPDKYRWESPIAHLIP